MEETARDIGKGVLPSCLASIVPSHDHVSTTAILVLSSSSLSFIVMNLIIFRFSLPFFVVVVAVVEGGGFCIETNGTKTSNHFDVIFRLAKSNHTIEPFVAICRASISTDPNVKPHSQSVGQITIYPSYSI